MTHWRGLAALLLLAAARTACSMTAAGWRTVILSPQMRRTDFRFTAELRADLAARLVSFEPKRSPSGRENSSSYTGTSE